MPAASCMDENVLTGIRMHQYIFIHIRNYRHPKSLLKIINADYIITVQNKAKFIMFFCTIVDEVEIIT